MRGHPVKLAIVKPSRFAAVMGAIGKYTGISTIAGAAVDSHDALVEAAVKAARKNGVPESTIESALRLKAKHDRAADMLAMLFPGIVISPTAMRALAGKPTAGPHAPKPVRSAPKSRQRRRTR